MGTYLASQRTMYRVLASNGEVRERRDQLRRRGQRGVVLDAAHAAHPERFVRVKPQPPLLPAALWISSPAKEVLPIGVSAK
ncbi:MAG: hypothetical protein JF887_07775 [Candidatus Dormibacteraeota bacterium]|uniref:Uncharacterized protein n=1 Tax=Candidatus Amunia macphersoniae TaxID=3127014 RepID=A0A934KIB5_9BACT|nr:hypothetical protein [Candidatus Dormibacteraeota bacterium]